MWRSLKGSGFLGAANGSALSLLSIVCVWLGQPDARSRLGPPAVLECLGREGRWMDDEPFVVF